MSPEREAEIRRLNGNACDDIITDLLAEIDTLRFIQRYGTPFDPTGAKTGSEIQSLRRQRDELVAVLRWLDECDEGYEVTDSYGARKCLFCGEPDYTHKWTVVGECPWAMLQRVLTAYDRLTL